MKTKVFSLILLSLTLLLNMSACKKKEQPQPEPEPTIQEILINGEWFFYKTEIYDSNDNLTNSGNPNFTMEFTVSVNYYFKNEQGDILHYGTYSINENTDPKELTLTKNDGGYYYYKILEITENHMKLKLDLSGGYYIHYFRR